MQSPVFCTFSVEVRKDPTHTSPSIATVPSQTVILEHTHTSIHFNFMLSYVICVSLQIRVVLFLTFFADAS